jgi:DNA-binding Lrp family transcriptional regulator
MASSNAQRRERARSIRLDAIDRHIIQILQRSSKITNAALSETVGISAPSTLERVRKLETAGVITGYVALIDATALNQSIMAIVQVSLNSHSSAALDKAKTVLSSFDEVLACWHTAGDDDFMLKVLVADMGSYEKFISHKLSTVPAISKIRTAFVLTTVKETTQIPLDNTGGEPSGGTTRRSRRT